MRRLAARNDGPETDRLTEGTLGGDETGGAAVPRLSRFQRFMSRRLLSIVVAIIGSVVVSGVVIAALGSNPIDAYRGIFLGAIGSETRLGETLRATAPLIFTGITAAVSFSGRLWNVGGEGQLFAGAIASVLIALSLPGLPGPLVTILALLGGMLAGSFWAFLAGVMKAYVNANEVIVCLMLNFIAILGANAVITGPWRHGVSPQTRVIPDGVGLPLFWKGAGVGVSELLAVVAVIVAFVLLKRTAFGFGIRAIGASHTASMLAGFSIRRVTISSFTVAGAFSGLAGAIAVVGVFRALLHGFSEQYGFIGIAVALVARLNPLWIPPAALFFAIITVGGQKLTATAGIDPALSDVIIALFVVLLLAFGVIRMRYSEGT